MAETTEETNVVAVEDTDPKVGDSMVRFVTLQKRRRELETELDEIKAESDELAETIMTFFEQTGQSKARVSGLTLYIHTQLWANAKDGDYAAANAALRAAGLGDMIQERFNTNTLSAWVRERVKEGEQLPESFKDAINVTQVASLRAIARG